MYLIINGKRYTVSRRIAERDTVRYLTVEPAPGDVSGAIRMYDDNGFPISSDDASHYARWVYSGTLLTLTNRPLPQPPKPESFTPAQQRENAYNTEAVIPWEGGYITVTDAAQKWQYYAAEGSDKANTLTDLIAQAKAEIRAQYPDEEVRV